MSCGADVNVLLIEDHERVTVLLTSAMALLDPCIHVSTAGTLNEGMIHLGTMPCDVVLLDLGLPDAVGVTALRAIRLQYPTLPVIVVTGALTDTLEKECRKHGAAEVLYKGAFSLLELVQKIHAAVIHDRLGRRYQVVSEKLMSIEDSVSKMESGIHPPLARQQTVELPALKKP